MTAPGSFTAGDVLQASDVNELNVGQVAYGQFGDVTVTNSGTDVGSVTFTLTSSRRIFMYVSISQIDALSSANYAVVRFQNDSVSGSPSSYYYRQFTDLGSITSVAGGRVLEFAAGTHTIYLIAYTDAGSCRFNEVGTFNSRNVLAMFDVGEP